jgi:hypothetical protein
MADDSVTVEQLETELRHLRERDAAAQARIEGLLRENAALEADRSECQSPGSLSQSSPQTLSHPNGSIRHGSV